MKFHSKNGMTENRQHKRLEEWGGGVLQTNKHSPQAQKCEAGCLFQECPVLSKGVTLHFKRRLD